MTPAADSSNQGCCHNQYHERHSLGSSIALDWTKDYEYRVRYCVTFGLDFEECGFLLTLTQKAYNADDRRVMIN